MNRKQKICVCIGVLIITGMLLYPPVYIMVGNLRFYSGVENVEFTTHITVWMFIPTLISEGRYQDINWKFLLLELTIVILISVFFVYLAKDKINERRQSNYTKNL